MSHGLRIASDGRLDDRETDLLVVPGGGWNAQDKAGAWAEAERRELPDALAAAHARGTMLEGYALAECCWRGPECSKDVQPRHTVGRSRNSNPTWAKSSTSAS